MMHLVRYGPQPTGGILVPKAHWLIVRFRELADGTTWPPVIFIGGMN